MNSKQTQPTASPPASPSPGGSFRIQPGEDRRVKTIELQGTVARCYLMLDGGGNPSADSWLCVDSDGVTDDSTFYACNSLPKSADDLHLQCEVLFAGYDG